MTQVVHVTDNFSPSGFGITTALMELTGQLGYRGVKQVIFSPGHDGIKPPDSVKLQQLPIRGWLKKWCYPVGFHQLFDSLVKDDSMVHIHGVWMAPQYLAAKRSLKKGIPCVLSPHNMLGEWWRKNGIIKQTKKSLYWNLISKHYLTRVNLLHALSPIERNALHKYFPHHTIEVIPNGINLHQIDQALLKSSNSSEKAEKYILILGRLHKVKGIELFINALAKINPSQIIRTIIAGPTHQEKYLRQLQNLVRSKNLENKITFLGPVFGQTKWNLLRQAWVVCAPSYSEGISMVALEAMSSSVPIITTHSAGIPHVPEGGGILIQPDVEELSQALIQSLSWSDNERAARGRAARGLIEKYYSWDVVGPQYLDLYQGLQS